MARVVRFREIGGPEVLRIEDELHGVFRAEEVVVVAGLLRRMRRQVGAVLVRAGVERPDGGGKRRIGKLAPNQGAPVGGRESHAA